MTYIDTRDLVRGLFPNNEADFNDIDSLHWNPPYIFSFKFTGNHSITNLLMTSMMLQQKGTEYIKILDMPYIPYSRMDRKIPGKGFSLKAFAALINGADFHKVRVFDPHSNVSLALFDRVVSLDINPIIQTVLTESQPNTIVFPDLGAMKKYSESLDWNKVIEKCSKDVNIGIGRKKRDLTTGKILSYKVEFKEGLKDLGKVLIIDDICSKGTTFLYAGKALRQDYKIEGLDLYVSHCERTVYNGELLKTTSPIDRFFTTDSTDIDNDSRYKTIEIIPLHLDKNNEGLEVIGRMCEENGN